MSVRALLLAIAALVAAVAMAPAATAAPTLPLGGAGRWIVDAEGRVVVTHGQNRVEKRAPYLPSAAGFDEADAAFLAAEGYNSVRLGVIWTAVEPAPGRYDEAYLAAIRGTVETLWRHGIVSILDSHQDMVHEKYQGQGFPGWAAIDEGGLNVPAGFPNNQFVNQALLQAYDNFWRNAPGPGGVGIQDRFADMWRHVASRMRDVPGVAGYDLLNEPWPGSGYLACIGAAGCRGPDAQLHAMQVRVASRIRSVDPVTQVWYEPFSTFNSVADTTMPRFDVPRSVFSFHAYCTVEGVTLRYDPSCEGSDRTVLDRAERRMARDGVPGVLSEFGATTDLRTLERIATIADERMVGWQHWAFTGHDPTTQASGDLQSIVYDDRLPPVGANLATAKLGVLSRPYPQLVAGTPSAWRYDRAARRFSARWSTARADGSGSFPARSRSEVAVPARQYPSGYAVRAVGAAIVSPPGATTLVLESCPGASTVEVEVTPGAARTDDCDPPSARLRVTVSPSAIRRGRRTVLRVVVRALDGARWRGRAGATVTAAGRSAVTGAGGRARLAVRPHRRGRIVVVARSGSASARRTVRVRAPR